MGKEVLAGDHSNDTHVSLSLVRLRHRAVLPRVRQGLRTGPALRLRGLLRAARGLLRLPRPDPVRHRGLPADLELQKIITTSVYGGTFITVDGTYDDVNRLASELAGEHPDWAFVNVNVRPYYAEGSKTLGFEIAEQLGWRLPEQVVVPIASGAQLVKVDKGFTELTSLGLVPQTPWRVFGAQATGCSPVSAAFAAGHDVVRPVRPDTIAKSLAIGNPADGPYVLDVAPP